MVPQDLLEQWEMNAVVMSHSLLSELLKIMIQLKF